jgi:hypothetical protein
MMIQLEEVSESQYAPRALNLLSLNAVSRISHIPVFNSYKIPSSREPGPES